MKENALKIEKTSQSLFESGKVVSKSVTWLFIVSSALVIISWTGKPTEPIPVPIVGLKLNQYYAMGVFLVIYTIALFRFVIATNYQKYLFWELSTLLHSDNIQEKPWQHLFPGSINYLMFHGYLHTGNVQFFNVALSILSILAVTVIPLPVIVMLAVKKTTDYFVITTVAISLFFYWGALKNIKAHIALDAQYRKVT